MLCNQYRYHSCPENQTTEIELFYLIIPYRDAEIILPYGSNSYSLFVCLSHFVVICGNGTSSKLLEETNIEDADFFIATTGNDEANLLSCILVKKYNVPTIIARVSNPDHEEAFMEVGIDNVISPEVTAAGLLEKLVTRPNVADLITLGEGDAEIFDMTITNDKVVGKKIGEISPTKDYIIIATYQKGKLVIPQTDSVISRGEKVTVLVKRGAFKKVAKKLEK